MLIGNSHLFPHKNNSTLLQEPVFVQWFLINVMIVQKI